MEHAVEPSENARLKLSEQIPWLDIVGKLESLQIPASARMGGKIGDGNVCAAAPVELPHQRAADKAGAAGDQDAALLPDFTIIGIDGNHSSDVTRISRVFHLSVPISATAFRAAPGA